MIAVRLFLNTKGSDPNMLLADVDLVDLGLLACGAGEEVLSGDYGSALIALNLIYPELHC